MFYLESICPCIWTGLVSFAILYFALFRWIGLKDKKLICFACCSLFWYGASCIEHLSDEAKREKQELRERYREAAMPSCNCCEKCIYAETPRSSLDDPK